MKIILTENQYKNLIKNISKEKYLLEQDPLNSGHNVVDNTAVQRYDPLTKTTTSTYGRGMDFTGRGGGSRISFDDMTYHDWLEYLSAASSIIVGFGTLASTIIDFINALSFFIEAALSKDEKEMWENIFKGMFNLVTIFDPTAGNVISKAFKGNWDKIKRMTPKNVLEFFGFGSFFGPFRLTKGNNDISWGSAMIRFFMEITKNVVSESFSEYMANLIIKSKNKISEWCSRTNKTKFPLLYGVCPFLDTKITKLDEIKTKIEDFEVEYDSLSLRYDPSLKLGIPKSTGNITFDTENDFNIKN